VRVRRGLLIALLLTSAGRASGQAKRHHFEPDDLELEHEGTLDLDLQAGPLRGDSSGKNRVFLPDFELGLGLLPNVQLEIDGTFSLDEFDARARHYTSDPLWTAMKLGLFDEHDSRGRAFAIGIELGPRLPLLDSTGIGYGAVALFGLSNRRLKVVLNAGGLIDPGATLHAPHPTCAVLGLDFNLELDRHHRWSAQSELSASYYLSSDPDELALTLGATHAVSPKLDVSATALIGFLERSDRAGLLLGISPQLDLF
jgi:hypothetical protein